MNTLIQKEAGHPYSLLYVGEECLLYFYTMQEAWECLYKLVSSYGDTENEFWSGDLHLVLAIPSETGVKTPQIGKIVKTDTENILNFLEYRELFGPSFEEFRDRVMNDWPRIQKALPT